MKRFKNQAAQGDTLFRRVPLSAIPANAKEIERENGAIIVAHSETQHHHVIRAAGVAMFEAPDNPLVAYLRMDAGVIGADVEHLREHDTHETLRLAGRRNAATCFEVRRQREWAPEGWRRAQD